MDLCESIHRLNRKIDRLSVPYAINEPLIESLLQKLESTALFDHPLYWLTMARITEVSVLCAGHYADNCEFQAAGDLLLTPRKIYVQVPPGDRLIVKTRHGRLSDQLSQQHDGAISLKDVQPEIVTPAILPYLHGRLEQSCFFSADYVDNVAVRMLRIADTMTFLATYQTFTNQALHQKVSAADEKERAFVERHLCRFSDNGLHRICGKIERLVAVTDTCKSSGQSALSASMGSMST